MSRKRKVIHAVFIFLLISPNNFFLVDGESAEETKYIIRSTVTFVNKGTYAWGFTNSEKIVSFFMNNDWQTVNLLNCSHNFEATSLDEDGNRIGILRFPRSNIGPNESLSYMITYEILSKPRYIPEVNESAAGDINSIPNELKHEYCGDKGDWTLNDPNIRELSFNLSSNENKVLKIVENFVVWLWDNIDWPQGSLKVSHEVPLYPNETLFFREGDCDDQSMLLVSLCRVSGIPAFVQIGCIFQPGVNATSSMWKGHFENSRRQIGWHSWAMVYIPPWGWLPVDITYLHGLKGNPVNAIKTSAVTMQQTIQYMNAISSEYTSNVRIYQEFLESNNFYVYACDEMFQGTLEDKGDLLKTLLDNWYLWLLLTIVIVQTAVMTILVRKIKRRKQ